MMMALIIGISNLLVGAAYVSLGLLSAWEAASQYRYRGLSRFGLGFSLMAASCGPHHLVHGWCVLEGGIVTPAMLVLTLTGLPAGIVFCWLRAEAMRAGRGDRTIAVNGRVMAAAVAMLLILVSALAGWAVASPPAPSSVVCTTPDGIDTAALVKYSNLWVAFTYAMVGCYLVDTQVRRYVTTRSWSLSGLSLAGVFPSCAAMHLILALTSSGETNTLPFDLLGVPASLYFLWVVRQLHADSVIDWNRRPLAGLAATPHRSPPWSDAGVRER